MPKQTFYNLTEEKKEKILHTCYEEFAKHDYEGASVSRIVKQLNIAKGSFYRYFESKRALYLFLLDRATEMRMENVKELFESPLVDFFDLFEKNFIMKIQFDLKFPLISAFLYNSMQERNIELGNILIRSKEMLVELLIPIIKKAQQNGILRTDIDIDVIAYSIIQVQIGIYDYLMLKYRFDFSQNIQKGTSLFPISEDEIIKCVGEFTKVLRNGLHNLK